MEKHNGWWRLIFTLNEKMKGWNNTRHDIQPPPPPPLHTKRDVMMALHIRHYLHDLSLRMEKIVCNFMRVKICELCNTNDLEPVLYKYTSMWFCSVHIRVIYLFHDMWVFYLFFFVFSCLNKKLKLYEV